MQSNRDIVVSIRCSIHLVSVSIRYGSKIIAQIIYDNTISDRPLELKIARSPFMSRLYVRSNISIESNRCIKIGNVLVLHAMKHMKS